jgi:hypothetical protein
VNQKSICKICTPHFADERAATEVSAERNGRSRVSGPVYKTTTDDGPATADEARELIRQVVHQQVQQILAETPSGLSPALHHQEPPVIEHHPVAAAHHALPVAAGPAPAPVTGSSLEVLLCSLQPLVGVSPTLIPAPAAADIQVARPATIDTTSNSFDAAKGLFKPGMQPIMKALDQLWGHLKVQPDSNGALKIVQSLISDTMKQALLEALPAFNAETCVYGGHGHIRDASRWVAENGDAGISINDMKEAHALNTAVERMCTGPRPQSSHYGRRPTFDYPGMLPETA